MASAGAEVSHVRDPLAAPVFLYLEIRIMKDIKTKIWGITPINLSHLGYVIQTRLKEIHFRRTSKGDPTIGFVHMSPGSKHFFSEISIVDLNEKLGELGLKITEK